MNFDKKFKGVTTSIVFSLILVMIISPSNFAIISTASADNGKGTGLGEAASPGKGVIQTIQTSTDSANMVQVKSTVTLSQLASSSSAAPSNATAVKSLPFYRGPANIGPQSSVQSSAHDVSSASITNSSPTPRPQVPNQYSGFEGSDYPSSCFCTPPDGNVAVGPNHIFEMVNSEGKVWSKSGTLLETIPMSTFFGTGSGFISDPRVVYDAQSGHWFASILDTDTVHNGFVPVAVSQTGDPTGAWWIYYLGFSNVVPDQPRLAVTDDKVTVVASDFPWVGGWTGDEIITLQKAQMIVGAATNFVRIGPDNTRFHVEPAIYPVAGQTDQWLAQDGAGGASAVEYLKIAGLPGISPVSYTHMFTTPITTTANPPPGHQPGTATGVETNDARILSASMRGGIMTWVSNDACSSSQACVRWDIVDTSGSGTKLQDVRFGVSGKDIYYPSVSQDQPESFGVLFDFSSPSEYPSIAFTGQSHSEPYGTVETPILVKAGSGPDTTGRHGDFHAVRADPATGIYYGMGEYNAAGSVWNTYITVNSISSGSPSAHATTLTLNPLSNLPWGSSYGLSGKLTDNNAGGIGVGGQIITFTTSAGSVIDTFTKPDGTFSTIGAAPSAITSVNVQAHFATTQSFTASDSPVRSYNTVKHSTILVHLTPSPNLLPYLRPIYFTTVLFDTSFGAPMASKTITWNGSGITGTPSNVTSAYGIATLTANSKSPVAKNYQVQSRYAGDSLYNSAASNIVLYTSQRHDTKVILWIPLNVTAGANQAFGATLMDTSFNGGYIVGQTVTFNGTGVPGVLSKVTNANGDALTFGSAPGTAGTWQVQGRFAGNSNYVQSHSIIKTYKTS